MLAAHASLNLPQPLGDGLILRLATQADTQALADFNARVLVDQDEPPELVSIWTRDLMSGRNPTTSAADFVVIEDTHTARIVSSACLIPQTWMYQDIPFPVGRPELVGTEPDYRRRGLARATLDTIHALSAAYGHMLQGITGIPWFYRQFGYEYALPLGGWREISLNDVPVLGENEADPYPVRRAFEEDIPALMRLYDRLRAGKLVTTLIDEVRWRYDLSGHTPGSDKEYRAYCILNTAGDVVGYYSSPARLWGSRLGVWEIEVEAGVSLRAVLPSVLRALKAQGEAYAAQTGSGKSHLAAIRLALGIDHPAYAALEARLGPLQRPYAWYIRLPDVPGFIQHIAPVLERRLVDSVMSGYTGELKITFYRGGLRLAFEKGRLIDAADWRAPETNIRWDGAGFPPLVFLKLLFGHRSLQELREAFPDCWAREEPTLLLNALFPKMTSWVAPLG